MPQNIIKTRGSTRASKPDAGGANLRSVPVFGVVKNNIDPIRSGRIQVYVSDFSSDDPDDARSWITVSYMSPFFGLVEPTANDTGPGTFKTNSSSYGFWNSPPDIGTTVICIFINGDMNYGFYIGCVPQPEALQMVPAIGAVSNVVVNEGEAKGYGGAKRLPVTNINTNNTQKANSDNFLNEPKPVHSYVADVMNTQGILRDTIRGPISSSAQRESPSRVGWGISTPGRPIYSGGFTDDTILDAAKSNKNQQAMKVISRRGGHSIVMDDGDLVGRDQLVRIRTALGHQILMSDDGQTLMILHSNGKSYVELGKEGTVDVYSTNSVNVRTQGDINLHADNDINIHATNNLNVKAKNINVESEVDTTHRIGKDYSVATLGKFTHKVGSSMTMQSGDEAGFVSDSVVFIKGSKINLNSGSPGVTPKDVPSIPVNLHSDTLGDETKGFMAAPGKLKSIASRAPAHAPWANAGQGVNVKTSLSASDSFPKAPSSVTDQANTVADAASGQTQISAAQVTTIPNVNAASSAIDKGTTASMLTCMKETAASNPLTTEAVKQGAGVIEAAGIKAAVVGAYAASPSMLDAAGMLKAGSGPLVNKLINSNLSLANSLPTNLFTGSQGISSLDSLVKNSVAQAGVQTSLIQKSQSMLTCTGVFSGSESPTAIAGAVMSGVQNGIKATTDVLKSVTTGSIPSLSALNGSAGDVMKSIGSGNFAAGIADKVTGGMGPITSSANSLAKGLGGVITAGANAAESAFNAIKNAFPTMKPGPVDLETVAASLDKAGENIAAQVGPSVSGFANSVKGGVPGSLSSAGLGSATSALDSLKTAAASASSVIESSAGALAAQIGPGVSGFAGSIKNAASVASGVSLLPGNPTGPIINQAAGAFSLPGTEGIKSAIDTNSATAMAGQALPSNLTSLVSGSVGSLKSTLGSIDKLGTGLSSSLMSSFPAAAAATIGAALGALTTGSSTMKLPSIGSDTAKLPNFTNKLEAGIPKPNISGTVPTSAADFDTLIKKGIEERKKSLEEIKALEAKASSLKKTYIDLQNSLPEGDPSVAEAEKAWLAVAKEAKTKTDILVPDPFANSRYSG